MPTMKITKYARKRKSGTRLGGNARAPSGSRTAPRAGETARHETLYSSACAEASAARAGRDRATRRKSSAAMTDTIAGIPVEVVPPKVQAGLRTQLTLQMAVSADAIRSVFGGREEHEHCAAAVGAVGRAGAAVAGAGRRDRPAREHGRHDPRAARGAPPAARRAERRRAGAADGEAAAGGSTWPGSSSASRPRRCARSRGSRARRSSSRSRWRP